MASDEKKVNETDRDSELETSTLLRQRSSSVRTYWQRWMVLGLYFAHIFIMNFVYSNFGPVAVLISCYYNIDLAWVNALPCVYLAVYVLLAFPAAWFIKRQGLKVTAVAGGCACAAGAWLRFAGTDSELYWLQFAGYAIISLTNLLELTASTLLPSVWFPVRERGSATAILAAIAPTLAIFGALCVGPFILHSPDTDQVCSRDVSRTSPEFLDWQLTINHQLFYYLLAQAIVASAVLPIAFFIPSAPPTAPSLSTLLKQKDTEETGMFRSCTLLLRNIHFLLFLIIGGLFVGAAFCFPVVYEPILVQSGYGGYQDKIGYFGLALAVISIIGMILVGKWIDRTKTFYVSSAVMCAVTTVLLAALALSVQLHAPFGAVAVLTVASGLCLNLYLAVVYDYGGEIAYPAPESLYMCVLSSCSQAIALVMLGLTSLLLDINIDRYSLWLFAAILFPATILAVLFQPETKRVKLDLPVHRKGNKLLHNPPYLQG